MVFLATRGQLPRADGLFVLRLFDAVDPHHHREEQHEAAAHRDADDGTHGPGVILYLFTIHIKSRARGLISNIYQKLI